MQPQSSEQIQTFVLCFGRFVSGLRRFAPYIPLESTTLAAFEFLENKLNNSDTLARYADEITARGESLADRGPHITEASQNLVAAYEEASIASRLLLKALKQRPGINAAVILALKTALGSYAEESVALPTSASKAIALNLLPPSNLAVQRFDSGTIVLGWQYNTIEPDIEFEIAIAVGDGLQYKQPREPNVSPSHPEEWAEHSITKECSYFHEARAANGNEVTVDTVIWFRVRAIRGEQERSDWTRMLSVVCHPTPLPELPGKGGFGLFSRRSL